MNAQRRSLRKRQTVERTPSSWQLAIELGRLLLEGALPRGKLVTFYGVAPVPGNGDLHGVCRLEINGHEAAIAVRSTEGGNGER